MHAYKLLSTFVKVNVQMSLAYRVDTIIAVLLNLFWLGWELVTMQIIFSNTATLGGWSFGDLITLLGVFKMINLFMAALIWPNTERFNTSVRDGSLDYLLLQPVSSLFLVSFSRITVWRLWDLILSVILVVAGMSLSGTALTFGHLAAFLVLLVSGIGVLFSLWIALISLTFWFTKFDNNVTILQALLDSGRYPATVYPFWLRALITYVIPIAVATTVPVQALRGELTLEAIALYLAVAVGAFLVARLIWHAGVRRYSGASS